MKKKLTTLVALMLVAIIALSGCGSKTTTDTSTTSDNTSSGDTTVAAQEVKLNIFIAQPRFREQYESYINDFCAKYESETGTKVTYELEMPSADTASEILKTRLTTGEDLDVFALHAINEIPQFYKAGYLEDLSGEAWVNTLYDSVKTAVSTNDGKVVALPLESLLWGTLYNKDLFNELGLTPALTLTDMQKNIDAIKAAGKTPFLAAYNESWIPQLVLPLTTGAFVNSSDKDFIDKMNNDEGSYQQLAKMFDIIDMVNANTNSNGLEIGGSDGCAEFAAGNYGIWVQGPWFSQTILEANPDFNLGVAPLPVSNDPDQAMVNASVSTSLAVSSFSKNKEAAKALVAYFLDADKSSEFFQAVQFNPLSTVHNFSTSPWIDEATAYSVEGKAYVDPSIPGAVKDESGKMLQAYYTGDASQEDVIDALDTAWQTYNDINQ